MKLKEIFESNQFLTDKSEIEAWLKKMRIENYEIDEHGFVNVDGDVDLQNKRLTSIPVKFGWVSGSFYVPDNKLTTLEGSPKEVGEGFYCTNNKLTSLKGAPREVGGDFSCAYNKLTSLEGAPREVGGGFYCYGNKFISEPDHSFININREFKWKN